VCPLRCVVGRVRRTVGQVLVLVVVVGRLGGGLGGLQVLLVLVLERLAAVDRTEVRRRPPVAAHGERTSLGVWVGVSRSGAAAHVAAV